MANEYFDFKNFRIEQSDCAMKVGTDSVLFGCWAGTPAKSAYILDIGCGTGVLCLFLAQRYPKAIIIGIEIDPRAAQQAHRNINNSKYKDRISIVNADFLSYSPDITFDLIISNPPYFKSSLQAPQSQRSQARHEECGLSIESLLSHACTLLKDDGEIALITPHPRLEDLRSYAAYNRIKPSRITHVQSKPDKQPSRLLSSWCKAYNSKAGYKETTLILNDPDNKRSKEFMALTSDFYIK